MNLAILCCSSSLQLVGLELGPLLESVPGVSTVTCASVEEWKTCDDESAFLLVWVDASLAELIESLASCFCQELVKKLWGRRVCILFDAASHEKGRRMDILSSIFPTCVFEGPQSVDKILEVWETTLSREDSLRSIQRSIDYCTGTGTSTLAEISDWMETKRERVLVVTGPLGSGKSVLLAQTCWRSGYFLDAEIGNPARRVVAACFLSSDTSAKLCIMTLADQLCSSFPTLKIEGEAELESMDPLVLFRRFIAEPLMKMKPKPQERAFVVIDGIDQTPWTEREDMVQAIVAQWERLIPDWLDLIVSTRPHLIPLIEGIRFSCLHLSEEERRRDIEIFMQKVSEHFLLPQLPVSPERGCNPWEWMAEKCQGWFPWLRALLACLKDVPPRTMTLLDVWFLDVPTNVLDSFIWQSLEQFLVGPLKDDLELYRTLLSVLAVARTALEASTVQTLLALDGFTIRESFFAELELLLAVGDQGIQLCHQAFATFLLNDKKSAVVVSKESIHVGKSLHVPAEYGRRALVQVLLQNPTAPDAVRELLFQLCSIGDWNTVRDHLCDFDWVFALVSTKGATETVIADLEKMYVWEDFADQQVLEVIQVLRDEMYTLCEHPDNLPMKLFSGIANWDHPILKSYAVSHHAEKVRPFLPVKAPALSSLRRRTFHRIEGVHLESADMDSFEYFLGEIKFYAFGYHEGMLIGATDGMIAFVWEFISGRLVRIVRFGQLLHESHVGSAGLGMYECPRDFVVVQGTGIVCGGEFRDVLWTDWNTGESSEFTLRGEDNQLVAMSIWGGTVVVATEISLFLWDAPHGRSFRYLLRDDFSVKVVAIHKNHVVSGAKDGTVKLWEVETGELQAVFRGHLKSVQALAIDEELIVSADADSVRLWNVHSNEPLREFDVTVGGPVVVSATQVAWIEKDKTARGFGPTSLIVWNQQSDKFWSSQDNVPWVGAGHEPVAPVLFQDSVISVQRREARLWDLRAANISVDFLPVFACCASDGLVVGNSCDGKKLWVWSGLTGDLLREISAVGANFIALSKGRLLTAIGDVPPQYISAEEVFTFEESPGPGLLDERRDSHTLRILDAATGHCLQTLQGSVGLYEAEDRIAAVHLSDQHAIVVDEARHIQSGKDGVRVWHLGLKQLNGIHRQDIISVSLDERGLASVSTDDTIRMWELEGLSCTWSAHHTGAGNVVLTNGYVISANNNEILVWNRESGTCSQTIERESHSEVQSLSADGDAFALASPSRVVVYIFDPITSTFVIHSLLGFQNVCSANLTSSGSRRLLIVQTSRSSMPSFLSIEYQHCDRPAKRNQDLLQHVSRCNHRDLKRPKLE